MQIRIEDLHLAVAVDIACGDNAFACCVDVHGLRAVTVQLCDNTLYVENDLGYILLDTRDGRELMLNAIDLDAACSSTRKRRKQDAAQGIAQRRAITTLERLYDKLAVGTILFQNFAVDTGLFDFDH